jgi:hypothetical protein
MSEERALKIAARADKLYEVLSFANELLDAVSGGCGDEGGTEESSLHLPPL